MCNQVAIFQLSTIRPTNVLQSLSSILGVYLKWLIFYILSDFQFVRVLCSNYVLTQEVIERRNKGFEERCDK